MGLITAHHTTNKAPQLSYLRDVSGDPKFAGTPIEASSASYWNK